MTRPSDAVIALKPCPFCKGEMMFRKALWPSDGNTDAIIHAVDSGCGLVVFDTGTTDESVIDAWNRRAIDAEAKDVAVETGAVADWLPMLTAPRDGTEIEIMRRSPRWYYASDDQKPIWEEAVRSHWINFNGGGWVWSGIVGEALAWRAIASAPTAVEGSNG